jgi:hypothetical protein
MDSIAIRILLFLILAFLGGSTFFFFSGELLLGSGYFALALIALVVLLFEEF